MQTASEALSSLSPSGERARVRAPMARRVPEVLRVAAKELRFEATKAEDVLWNHLRNSRLAGSKWRRQHPIGTYIVDFYCTTARLAIELDGAHHLEPELAHRDSERTEYLNGQGLRVLRFTNTQILTRIDAVLVEIEKALGVLSP
jgi:very-short-patch-repair endonuclease